jgi:hypothetical protein
VGEDTVALINRARDALQAGDFRRAYELAETARSSAGEDLVSRV